MIMDLSQGLICTESSLKPALEIYYYISSYISMIVALYNTIN